MSYVSTNVKKMRHVHVLPYPFAAAADGLILGKDLLRFKPSTNSGAYLQPFKHDPSHG